MDVMLLPFRLDVRHGSATSLVRGAGESRARPCSSLRRVASRAARLGAALFLAACACAELAPAEGSTYGCGAIYGAASSDALGGVLGLAETEPRRRVITYASPDQLEVRRGLDAFDAIPDSSGRYVGVYAGDGFSVWPAAGGDRVAHFELRTPMTSYYGNFVADDEPGTWICVPEHVIEPKHRPFVGPPLQVVSADGRRELLGALTVPGTIALASYCAATRDVVVVYYDGTLLLVNRDAAAKDWSGTLGFSLDCYTVAVVGSGVYVPRGASLVRFDTRERRLSAVPLVFDGALASISAAVGNRFVVGVTLERTPQRVRSQLVCCEAGADGAVSVVWRQTLTESESIGAVVYMAQWGGTVVMSPDGPPRFVPFPEGAGAR